MADSTSASTHLRKLYVVSSGSYSDYSVHFACPDKKTAQAMVKALKKERQYSDDYEVEELPVYSLLSEIEPLTWYRIEVDEDGYERRRWTYTNRPWETWRGEESGGWAPAGYAYGVSSRGYDVALKAARDHAAKRKAKKAGIA